MAKITIKALDANTEALRLIRSAVEGKMARLRVGIAATEKRLSQFEAKYQLSSTEFLKDLTAEDLEGGDLEYVEWAGECRILERLKADLKQLEAIEYADR